jgi:hypothetical protein
MPTECPLVALSVTGRSPTQPNISICPGTCTARTPASRRCAAIACRAPSRVRGSRRCESGLGGLRPAGRHRARAAGAVPLAAAGHAPGAHSQRRRPITTPVEPRCGSSRACAAGSTLARRGRGVPVASVCGRGAVGARRIPRWWMTPASRAWIRGSSNKPECSRRSPARRRSCRTAVPSCTTGSWACCTMTAGRPYT